MAISKIFNGSEIRVPGCYGPPGGFYEYRGFTRDMERAVESFQRLIFMFQRLGIPMSSRRPPKTYFYKYYDANR